MDESITEDNLTQAVQDKLNSAPEILLTDDDTNNSNAYPIWAVNTDGNEAIFTTSDKWRWNAFNGVMYIDYIQTNVLDLQPTVRTASNGWSSPDAYTLELFTLNTLVLTVNDDQTVDFEEDVTAPNFIGDLNGNAATATALQNARTIGGTSFNGTANIVPATITVADTTDTTCFVGLFEDATGDLAPKSDAGLTYNASTGALTATSFVGSISGNAATATALQNARTIGGVSFNGTANIVPQTIQSVNEATDTTCFPLFISASGSQSLQPLNNTALTFNSNTGALGATSFTGSGASLTSLNGSNISSGVVGAAVGGTGIANNVASTITISGSFGITFTVSGTTALTFPTTGKVFTSGDTVVRETPSGSINGSNVTFTLAQTPIAGFESIYLNGLLQEPGAGNDYTISGGTITYLTAPATGDKLRASYYY